MEQKLKQQRNRLFLRVTLILLAVWLAVSATYCVICLHSEKANVQNRMLANFSYAKQMMTASAQNLTTSNYVYITTGNLIELKDVLEKDFNSQMIVIDPDSEEILADTGNRIRVMYTFENDKGTYPDDYGYLDYRLIRNALSDEQYEKIAYWLNKSPDDGRSYELVCSRFYVYADKIMPIELAIIPAASSEEKFRPENITESFTLATEVEKGAAVFRNSERHLNVIPKDFFLHNAYNRDIIRQLTDEQRKKNVEVISLGNLDTIFYITDYFYLNALTFNQNTGKYDNFRKPYLGQYAKKVNLLESCRSELLAGALIILAFFLLIGAVLFLIIWHTVRTQILQESRRADLTNALAHDIKTPLFVISGYAYTLKENIDPEQREAALDKIISQTEEINQLVHKMLNLSKLDSYKMTLNRTEFDLYELVQEIAEKFLVLPDGKSITLTHSGNSIISADRELLKTAVQNLMDNAVKYSLPGSDIQVDVADRSLSIANRSEPLTRTELKQIWQPYVRKDKSRHQKGNGLGLSIVKSILDLHGIKYEMRMQDSATIVFRAEWKDSAGSR